jgi:hypothetical protein
MHDILSRMTIAYMRHYLLTKGWRDVSTGSERLSFEGPIHDGGKPYLLWIPASANQRGATSQIQNTLFALSSIEDREPREIAAEIFAIAEIAPSRPQPNEGWSPVHFRNEGVRAVVIEVGGIPTSVRVEPGGECRIECGASDNGSTRVELRKEGVRILGTTSVTIRWE